MLTHMQLNWIASLRPDEDFRFIREFGETIVIATGRGGVEIRMYEDGKVFAQGLYGAIMWESSSDIQVPLNVA